MISAVELELGREAMTLRERVDARRALDHAAGISYPPLSDSAAATLARLFTKEK